jgi:putative ABC transport system permease protein
MTQNHFKIALRQLRKQRMYSVVKIGGFALGIAACILIGLYIRDEASYDRSYPDADRIFRVISTVPVEGKPFQNNYMPAPLAKIYQDNFPEVVYAGRLMSDPEFPDAGSNEVRTAGQTRNTYEEGFAYADPQIPDIFQLPMVYGDRSHALSEPHTVILSKTEADKYFPGQDPVGKTLILNNDAAKPYRIGGVMQDFPASSHLQYHFLLSLRNIEFFPGELTNWQNNNYDVYVLLRPGANAAAFERRSTAYLFGNYIVPAMQEAGAKDAAKLVQHARLALQPVTDIHLRSAGINDGYTHGDVRFVWLFAAVAFFILVIASINFINLSTAKSANRAKEVGLRKVVGSTRLSLIGQFLAESTIYSVVSFIAGVLLAWGLLPYFNTLASKFLVMPWMTWWFVPALLVAAVITGILAGLYPAFYLSGFRPSVVLKGSISTGSKNPVLRNGLVVFQFTASVILIICTLVIYNQMKFILNRKPGFDKDQVLLVQGTNLLGPELKNFKTELLKLPAVKGVTVSDYLPVGGATRSGTLFYKEGEAGQGNGVGGQIWEVDPDYLKTMGIKLVAGRNFSAGRAADSQAVVINQTLAGKLNLKDAVGKRIVVGGKVAEVIGVTADFNFESIRDHVDGLCMQLGNSPLTTAIKVNAGDMRSTLSGISAVWKQFAPSEPIRYSFLDQRFAAMYDDVQRMAGIFTSFALLAVIISSLGLFALAAFMAEQRRKEIGIRKVLGASVQGITVLLSLDFVKLVGIAILIATPVAWLGMNKWLQDFAYRTSISWWILASAALMAIVIAVLTVSFQSVKAALANPVKSLRSE